MAIDDRCEDAGQLGVWLDLIQFAWVVSQSFGQAGGSSASGHTYPASAANCAKPDCSDWSN